MRVNELFITSQYQCTDIFIHVQGPCSWIMHDKQTVTHLSFNVITNTGHLVGPWNMNNHWAPCLRWRIFSWQWDLYRFSSQLCEIPNTWQQIRVILSYFDNNMYMYNNRCFFFFFLFFSEQVETAIKIFNFLKLKIYFGETKLRGCFDASKIFLFQETFKLF